jgi:hypothetical protein
MAITSPIAKFLSNSEKIVEKSRKVKNFSPLAQFNLTATQNLKIDNF